MSKESPTQKDPRAIAIAAAEEYFAALMHEPNPDDVFAERESPLDTAIDEISKLIQVKYASERPIPEEESGTWEIIGRQAGYLVGVQVGLRLRGGVR